MRVLIRPFPLNVSRLPRPDGEAHVWAASLGDLPFAEPELVAVLSAAEAARAERYKHPGVRDQFVRARGLLRVLLGWYLDATPSAVSIGVNPDGKPVHFPTGANRGFEFNVSHTDGLALFAVADRPVGVDAERVRPMPTADDLVARFFTPSEAEQYQALPAGQRPAAFFRGWTCKEAVLKGIGCGARDLDRCVIDLDPARPPQIVGPPATAAGWSVATWEPAVGYVGAVAVAAAEPLRLEAGCV